MNMQDAFDIVVKESRKQKIKCIDIGGKCVYRNSIGQKCFIGMLMSDEVYINLTTENRSASIFKIFNTQKGLLEEGGFNFEDRHFYQDLQALHDRYDSCFWETEFRIFARKYGLKVPELENA